MYVDVCASLVISWGSCHEMMPLVQVVWILIRIKPVDCFLRISTLLKGWAINVSSWDTDLSTFPLLLFPSAMLGNTVPLDVTQLILRCQNSFSSWSPFLNKLGIGVSLCTARKSWERNRKKVFYLFNLLVSPFPLLRNWKIREEKGDMTLCQPGCIARGCLIALQSRLKVGTVTISNKSFCSSYISCDCM